jgi:hypothetical protein
MILSNSDDAAWWPVRWSLFGDRGQLFKSIGLDRTSRVYFWETYPMDEPWPVEVIT